MTAPLARAAARMLAIAAALTLIPGWPGAPRAAPPAIVVLQSGPLAAYQAVARSFRAAGPAAPVDLSLEDPGPDAVARRLQSTPPDVIVAIGLRAAAFARDRFPRVPMVFCAVPNFERHELSGTRITGVGFDVPERAMLRALRDAVPAASRVGVLTGPGEAAFLRSAREAAAAAGLSLVEAPVASPTAVPDAARALAGRVDALWLPADPVVATPESFQFLLELSLRERKPLLVFSESLVRAGALLTVAPDCDWVGGRAAEAVRRVLSGERAGDIPVTPLRRSRVVVNEATARAIGCPLPAALLRDAEVLR